MLKLFINIGLSVILVCANFTFAQSKIELNDKKVELLNYFDHKVFPNLNKALVDAEKNANTRWGIFGGASLTVSGFVLWQYQKAMASLQLKIDSLLLDQERLIQQVNQNRAIRLNEINTARNARTQTSSGVDLGGVFRESVNVPAHRNLTALTQSLDDICPVGVQAWWRALQDQTTLQRMIENETHASGTVMGQTTDVVLQRQTSLVARNHELDRMIELVEGLEERLFNAEQAENALNIQKIRQHSSQIQVKLQEVRANYIQSQTRLSANVQHIENLESQFKNIRTRYYGIGAATLGVLAAAGFAANVYWVNHRYADYFGKNLSEQKISTASTYNLKKAVAFDRAKMKILELFQGCPESDDYTWINDNLNDLEEAYQVQAWIDSMHMVCMELTLFNEDACRT